MKSITYKCSDCQHTFDGNDFTTECTQCNSHNISAQNTRTGINKPLLKKILIGVGIGIVLILLVKICSGPDTIHKNKVPQKVGVTVEPKDGGYYFSAYTIDIKGKKSVIPAFGVDAIKNTQANNNEVAFDKKNGQLFICYSDTGLSALKFVFKFADFGDFTWTGDLHLFGKAPSSDAKCPGPTPTWDDFIIAGPKNCEFELQLTKIGAKNGFSLKQVMISINGLNGKYTDKLKWKAENAPNGKYDVFILYNEIDTVKNYPSNNGAYPKCVEWTPEKAAALAQKLNNMANAYGANPSNKNVSRPFREFVFGFSKQSFSLDGQTVDMADLENTMSVEFENNGRKFKLKTMPTFNADGSQVTLHFVRI